MFYNLHIEPQTQCFKEPKMLNYGVWAKESFFVGVFAALGNLLGNLVRGCPSCMCPTPKCSCDVKCPESSAIEPRCFCESALTLLAVGLIVFISLLSGFAGGYWFRGRLGEINVKTSPDSSRRRVAEDDLISWTSRPSDKSSFSQIGRAHV